MADANFLAEIQKGKKLKKNTQVNDRSSPIVAKGSETASGGTTGPGSSKSSSATSQASAMPPTNVGGGGGGMMSEMQRKLQARQNGESIKTSASVAKPANPSSSLKPPTPANSKPLAPSSSASKPPSPGFKPPMPVGVNQPLNTSKGTPLSSSKSNSSTLNKPSAPPVNKPNSSTMNKPQPPPPKANPSTLNKSATPVATSPIKTELKGQGVDLSKYQKLQKAGLPQGAIEHAMVKDGVDPALLFGSSEWSGGETTMPTAPIAVAPPKLAPMKNEASSRPPSVNRAPPPRPSSSRPPPPTAPASVSSTTVTKPPPPPTNKPLPSTATKPPPKPVSSAPTFTQPKPPASVAKPSSTMKVDLSKYQKMQNAGLPQGAIEHAMVKDGVDPQLLFGSSEWEVAESPASAISETSLYPSPPPPPPSKNTLESSPPAKTSSSGSPNTARPVVAAVKNTLGNVKGMLGGKAAVPRQAQKDTPPPPPPSMNSLHSITLSVSGVAGVCEWLQKVGAASTPNITREQASHEECKRVADQMQRDDPRQLAATLNMFDVHSVAGGLKEHFKTLREPITTYNLYSIFINLANSNSNDSALATSLCETYKKVPEPNYSELKTLLQFLNSITTVDKNMLGYTWGPHLIRAEHPDPIAAMSDTKLINRIIAVSISSYPIIFGGASLSSNASAGSFRGAENAVPSAPQFRLPPRGMPAIVVGNAVSSKPPPPPRNPSGRTSVPPPPPVRSSGGPPPPPKPTLGSKPPAPPPPTGPKPPFRPPRPKDADDEITL